MLVIKTLKMTPVRTSKYLCWR